MWISEVFSPVATLKGPGTRECDLGYSLLVPLPHTHHVRKPHRQGISAEINLLIFNQALAEQISDAFFASLNCQKLQRTENFI